jgi:hypothetical protein
MVTELQLQSLPTPLDVPPVYSTLAIVQLVYFFNTSDLELDLHLRTLVILHFGITRKKSKKLPKILPTEASLKIM